MWRTLQASRRIRPDLGPKLWLNSSSILGSQKFGSAPFRRFSQSSSLGQDTPSVLETGVSEPVLNALGEPTFQSLGLAHGYPSGWVQSLLEVIHVQTELPWWLNIVTG